MSLFQLVCGVTSEDVVYINLPLYHSAGFCIGFGGCIERGENQLFFCDGISEHQKYIILLHYSKLSLFVVSLFRKQYSFEEQVFVLSVLG